MQHEAPASHIVADTGAVRTGASLQRMLTLGRGSAPTAAQRQAGAAPL
ncbi:hypothetical protein [Hymenobacter sp.]